MLTTAPGGADSGIKRLSAQEDEAKPAMGTTNAQHTMNHIQATPRIALHGLFMMTRYENLLPCGGTTKRAISRFRTLCTITSRFFDCQGEGVVKTSESPLCLTCS